jgi:hypothetical protein
MTVPPVAIAANNPPMSAAQAAGVQLYLGRTVTDVAVVVAGVTVAEPGLLELVETRVAEPLAMRDVRATIDHLLAEGAVSRGPDHHLEPPVGPVPGTFANVPSTDEPMIELF